jgi:hypothetical protein
MAVRLTMRILVTTVWKKTDIYWALTILPGTVLRAISEYVTVYDIEGRF